MEGGYFSAFHSLFAHYIVFLRGKLRAFSKKIVRNKTFFEISLDD